MLFIRYCGVVQLHCTSEHRTIRKAAHEAVSVAETENILFSTEEVLPKLCIIKGSLHDVVFMCVRLATTCTTHESCMASSSRSP